MSSYTYKQILSKAKDIKKEIESNGALKTSPKWGYYIGQSILHPKKDITKISFDNASSPSGTKINATISKDKYITLTKNMVSFTKGKNHRLPNFMQYGSDQITRDLYVYMLSKILVFYDKEKRLPNYTEVDYRVLKTTKKSTISKTKSNTSANKNCQNPYTSSPHYLSEGCNRLGQCTPYYCGPHSVHQILKKFGVTNISESQLAAWGGTTSSGTDHEGINTMVAKAAKTAGIKLSTNWYYLSDFGSTTAKQFAALAKQICQPNIGMLLHIGYQNGGRSADGTIFGHYEDLDKIDIKEQQVRALNSLGNRCGSGYCGHTQWRSYGLQKQFINNKHGVKSVCIITKK